MKLDLNLLDTAFKREIEKLKYNQETDGEMKLFGLFVINTNNIIEFFFSTLCLTIFQIYVSKM